MKRKLLLFFAAAALCILSACSANDMTPAAVLPTDTPSPTPAPTVAPTATPAPSSTPAPLDVYGVPVCWDDAEIDLRDVKIDDAGAALAETIPSLPELRRVDMTGCGLTNEEMGVLQSAFPDVTFVWTLGVYNFSVSSDTTYFITNPAAGFSLTDRQEGPDALRYCRDMIALDLGHCHLNDLSFLESMPHLCYLIIADNYGFDLAPLTSLSELEWLEMFGTDVQDVSPLLECTALRHLNVCYVSTPGDALFETLSQMTWLRRLWCTGTYMSLAQIDALREALPDTEVWYSPGDESSGGTWRCDEDYYAMRDAFHMYYMDVDGETVERMSEEELAAVHQKFWGY